MQNTVNHINRTVVNQLMQAYKCTEKQIADLYGFKFKFKIRLKIHDYSIIKYLSRCKLYIICSLKQFPISELDTILFSSDNQDSTMNSK